MTNKTIKTQSGITIKAEIRRADNDNIITSFEHVDSDSTNYISKGYAKLKAATGLPSIEIRNRYYVTKV